jgi:hypothetical protein
MIILKFKVSRWNPIFRMCVCVFLEKKWMHNNIFLLGKKMLPYQKEQDFINGHCIIFLLSFCLAMFHGSQTWSPMAIENL